MTHEKAMAQASHTVVKPEAIKWKEVATGIELAVLSGDMDTEGAPFVFRLRLKSGVKFAPHWHPVDEHLTVVTGTFYMGMGEQFNESAATELPAGSYGLMPKETRHFGWTKGETILQIHGVGPWKTFFVGAAAKPDQR